MSILSSSKETLEPQSTAEHFLDRLQIIAIPWTHAAKVLVSSLTICFILYSCTVWGAVWSSVMARLLIFCIVRLTLTRPFLLPWSKVRCLR